MPAPDLHHRQPYVGVPTTPGYRCLTTDATTRIEEVAPGRLIEKFSRSEGTTGPSVTTRGGDVLLRVGDEQRALDREAARDLRDALDDALTERRAFLHTVGVHREDGSYVVERRGADSAGHRKVFESLEALRRLYDRLPAEFTAEDVTATGVTDGRRHLLVRHVAEHPAFDCELVSRQPLTARKTAGEAGPEPDAESDRRRTARSPGALEADD